MQFEQLGLSDSVLRAVRTAGYQTPTEIQARAIPPAVSGGDVIGRAKTGSGKTAAFVLPILDRLEGGRRPSRGIVRALVLTPTRELAQQVSDAARNYGRYTKLSSDAIYGGVSIEPQLKRLGRGLDILAATPGRLIDHMQRGSIDLSRCEVLIVDEADRMFDMGFINDVKRIIKAIPKQRQTLLFSATMSKEVRRLTTDIMKDPSVVEIGIEGNPAESVRQQFLSVPKQAKLDLLFHLIEKNKMESVLVFSRTKHGADKISKRLMRSGVSTAVLHSNRSQSQRMSALRGFRDGHHRVLVATDIAARGIDVVGISHVINYDTPTFAEDYVHRIGRTGRADASGDAITFVSSEERSYLRRIESFVGRRYAVEPSPEFKAAPVVESAIVEPRSENGRGNGRNDRNDRNDGRGKRFNGARKNGQRSDSAGSDSGRRNAKRSNNPGRPVSSDEATSFSAEKPFKRGGKPNGKKNGAAPVDKPYKHAKKPAARKTENAFADGPGRNDGIWKAGAESSGGAGKPKSKRREWNFTERKNRKRDPRFSR